MLRFRIGSIPVAVQPGHWLTGVVLGAFALQVGSGRAWPDGVIAAGGAGAVTAQLTVVAVWTVVVFVSVLVHELGHAVAMRAYRYHPSIQLVLFGGATSPNATAPLSTGREVVSTLAGPLFGALLGGACLLLARAVTAEVPHYAAETAARANLGWALFNLLPLLPLDGGRISMAVFSRFLGRAGMVVAYLLGLATCAAVVLWTGFDPTATVFVALFALQSVRGLVTLWRTEPPGPPPRALLEAERALRDGAPDEARRLAEPLLEAELPVPMLARVHHLLGWVALKEGQGRRALDHFSQVQGRGIEPHAVAAAFSLVGDDARAVPLWEQAWNATHDEAVLHEWAGALLRAGREPEAARLPGVDLARAYGCAESVAFLRGAYSEAARLAEAALAHGPTARRAYDAACALARAGALDRAMAALERARALGWSDAEGPATDPDLTSLFGRDDFHAWLASLRAPEGESARP